jgi:hypothetical protein
MACRGVERSGLLSWVSGSGFPASRSGIKTENGERETANEKAVRRLCLRAALHIERSGNAGKDWFRGGPAGTPRLGSQAIGMGTEGCRNYGLARKKLAAASRNGALRASIGPFVLRN